MDSETRITENLEHLEWDRNACLAAGMDDYLSKPFDQEQLRLILGRWLKPEGEKENCLAAGMDDYLSKPFSQEQLGLVLEKWLPHRRSADETKPLTVRI